MSDLALRRAVAKCAGWRWIGLERVKSKGVKFQYASTGGTPFFRLRTDKPISWDDVMAACEEAIKNGKLHKSHCPVVSAGLDSAEDVAWMLCALCGVEVEDE